MNSLKLPILSVIDKSELIFRRKPLEFSKFKPIDRINIFRIFQIKEYPKDFFLDL